MTNNNLKKYKLFKIKLQEEKKNCQIRYSNKIIKLLLKIITKEIYKTQRFKIYRKIINYVISNHLLESPGEEVKPQFPYFILKRRESVYSQKEREKEISKERVKLKTQVRLFIWLVFLSYLYISKS